MVHTAQAFDWLLYEPTKPVLFSVVEQVAIFTPENIVPDMTHEYHVEGLASMHAIPRELCKHSLHSEINLQITLNKNYGIHRNQDLNNFQLIFTYELHFAIKNFKQ